jgi:hypothetical protein
VARTADGELEELWMNRKPPRETSAAFGVSGPYLPDERR